MQNFGDVKNEVFEMKIAFFVCFSFFYVGEIETDKRNTNKMEKAKNPIKICFLKVVIQKCEKSKKMDFWQNLPETMCVRKGETTHFRAHYLFLAKIFFGPKQCKPRNTIKIGVSAEIGQNQK